MIEEFYRSDETRVEARCQVPADASGRRVDQVAAVLLPDHSRNQLIQWLRSGELRLDGQQVPPKQRVRGGEWLSLEADTPNHADWRSAQDMSLDLVYEDESLLVINKPPGLVVHPGAGNPDQTLVNGLLAYRPALAALPRAGLIHRLDKDTSGLLVVAGNSRSLQRLQQALAAHDIERTYVAVVEGRLSGGRDIDAPIGRDPQNRLRQRVRDDGRHALTHVRVLARYRAHTQIEAQLATGRTHQIRVHLSSIGFPLVGDRRYGARGRLPTQPSAVLIRAITDFRRQALHARRLSFLHPETGTPLQLEAPLPVDLQNLCRVLQEDADAGR